jgi:hypothetical protein
MTIPEAIDAYVSGVAKLTADTSKTPTNVDRKFIADCVLENYRRANMKPYKPFYPQWIPTDQPFKLSPFGPPYPPTHIPDPPVEYEVTCQTPGDPQ